MNYLEDFPFTIGLMIGSVIALFIWPDPLINLAFSIALIIIAAIYEYKHRTI
jgi:FtsH-binding integral membrane protein